MQASSPGKPGSTMSKLENVQRCDLCKVGNIVKRKREVAFRQWTDKGYVFCRVTIPMGICQHCGSQTWDQATEAIIEAAVRTEYEKLR
jgi:hypothetical protein